MMRRKVKQLLAAGMALAVLATNLTPLSFAAERADAEPAAAAGVETYDARAKRDWEYTGCLWSNDNKTVIFNYKNKKNGSTQSVTVNSTAHKMKSPTCTEEGKTRYTATVYSWDALDGQMREREKTVPVPKLDHTYPATPEEIVFVSLDNLGNKPTAQATYRCTRCKETKTETVTDLTYVEVKKATCTEGGEGYWVAKAGSKTVNSAHVHPKKTDHDFTKKDADHVTFDFAEDGKSADATIRCAHCDATTTENVPCTAKVTTPATCTEKGTTTYTAVCGTASETTTRQDVALADHDFSKKDADHVTFAFAENGKTADATIRCAHCDATTTETVTCTAEVTTPATCTEKGTTTYTAVCGTASETTTRKDVPALDHSYGNNCDVQWDDSTYKTATLTWECDNEGCDVNSEGHFKSQTLTAVEKVTKPATCTDTGRLLHEVSYEFGGETEYLRQTTTIPALGHSYGNNCDVQWDDSTYKTATLTWECDNEGCDVNSEGHFKSQTLTAVEKVTKPATCTDTGRLLHEVSYEFGGETEYLRQTTTIPALGHSYGNNCDVQWDDSTYKTATLTWECDNEGCDVNSEGHFKSQTLTAVEKVTKPATCTDTGRLLHEVSYEFGGETEYLRQTTTIPALGHDFTQKDAAHVTFAFEQDGKTAVATIQCGRCDVTTTENVTCTAEVTTPATCTEMGTTTYTAACGTASDTTTRVDIPALGHRFTDYSYDNNAVCTEDGTETAKCDRCDATDTRTASGTAHCALHLVDGAQVCPVCGKVDGSAALNAVSADFDATPDTVGLRLVVRVGSLPSGKRIMTVVFVDGRGCMVPVSGIYKVRVSLANVKAQLGESDVADFTHTLTLLNAADGAKTDVGYALENGTLIFDARFDGRACLLQID